TVSTSTRGPGKVIMTRISVPAGMSAVTVTRRPEALMSATRPLMTSPVGISISTGHAACARCDPRRSWRTDTGPPAPALEETSHQAGEPVELARAQIDEHEDRATVGHAPDHRGQAQRIVVAVGVDLELGGVAGPQRQVGGDARAERGEVEGLA